MARWDKIAQPKKNGGLGINDIHNMNKFVKRNQ
jgi:hypothetical protein